MTNKLTAQDIFDRGVLGIISQLYRPSRRFSTCVYDGPKGRHCHVGWVFLGRLNTVWASGPETESHLLREEGLAIFGKEAQLMYQCKQAHDICLTVYGKEKWQTRMAEIALEYGLDDSSLYFERAPSLGTRVED